MTMPRPKLLTLLLAAVLAAVTIDAAAARHKKHRVHHYATATEASSGFWSNLVPTARDGTPIIMKGYRAPAVRHDDEMDKPRQRADRPVHIPRGSSSYIDIPPVNPSPNSPNSPPARALLQPPPEPYKPPPITTYSDRVTNCIHSYPLNAGRGNNPTDQQSYVRQCAN
jgi:hypothetical protein